MAGSQSRKEPSKLAQQGKERPDLQIFSPQRDWLIDVSVTHPLCPTHRVTAAKEPLNAAGRSVKKKDHKYVPMAEYQQAEFSAFACETLGGLDKSAIKVVNKVASIAKDNVSIYSHSTVRWSLLDSVAIAIQRGNARVMIAASIKKRSHRQRQ
jgi:hypothetical protein